MKKVITFSIILFITLYATAQTPRSVTLNVYGGYTFNDKVNFDAFHTKVKGGFQYGGGLEYFIQRNQSLEFSYQRLDTRFPLYTPAEVQVNNGKDKGALNYFLVGASYYMPSGSNDHFVPFIGGGLGVGVVEGEKNSATKFAWNFKGGVKILSSSSVSFKLQAYVQSIISTFGSDYWVTAGGAVVSVADYATIFQFGLGGAVCFDFKKK